MSTNDATRDGDNLLKKIEAMAEHDAAMVRCGAAAVELRVNPALRNLGACYRKATKDEDARIPSYLQAAITNALALLVESAFAAAERRAEPHYQERADGGGDIGPGGTALVPGS